MTKANEQDIRFLLTRLVAHFPRRDINEDAVVIGDITAELQKHKISTLAVASACTEIWKESTKENPWLPSSGHIFAKIAQSQEKFERWYRGLREISEKGTEKALRQMALPIKKPLFWAEMDEIQRENVIICAEGLSSSTRKTYLECVKAPQDLITEKEKNP